MSAVLDNPNFTVSNMNSSDLDEVMAIEENVYTFPWSKQIFIDCMRVGYYCFVVRLENKVVGYAVMSAAAGEAHLLNLCTKKNYQRLGVAKLLLGYVIELAKSKKVQSIFLEVRPSNQGAIKLYEMFGFNQVGTRKDYYPARSGREDAVILALTVIN